MVEHWTTEHARVNVLEFSLEISGKIVSYTFINTQYGVYPIWLLG